MISAHGDKAEGYKGMFQDAGIHYYHGAAMYLLTYMPPFNNECRNTENGYVDPGKWVVANASRFLKHLPPVGP